MSFVSRGGIAGFFAFIAIVAFVVALFPQVPWSTKGDRTVSLWRQCYEKQSNCTALEKFSRHVLHDSARSEREGTIASCVLAGFFCLVSLFTLCCKSKPAALTVLLLACVFGAVAVGCWYKYADDTLDNEDGKDYDLSYGFGLACLGFACSFFASLGACCLSKEHDGYVTV
eukprot:m.26511 g.26511  ORF g.26511 m.26511 type:complete len:171 (-) comp13778_c0_seq1:58-570(-)